MKNKSSQVLKKSWHATILFLLEEEMSLQDPFKSSGKFICY